jgi:hypothetical protein
MNKKRYKTGFLLPTVSFLTGMASAFSIWGNFYSFKTSESGEEADCRAIENDWQMVGQDLEDALHER